MNYNINSYNTKLITVQDFASRYGIGINKSYQIVHKKDFPKIKVGRKILIIEDKVDKFFTENIGQEF
ncbi:MAG: helix-turn-helix domain-containing protein [Romboutsia timonensis]|uniref:helix-turn-helix domain-containing protein n=1 Tax=Romboutsia timonensis TaxID=1776391 RepID=UPI003993E481